MKAHNHYVILMIAVLCCVQTLDEPGEGRVLVVDGQASMRCALLGDILGAKLHKNGFSVRVMSHEDV